MLKKINNWVLTTYVKKQEDLRMVAEKVIGNQRGMGAVEYGLVLAVIVLMIVGIAMSMSQDLQKFFKNVMQKVLEKVA
jgi:Flp pilus assembly pilin Flp